MRTGVEGVKKSENFAEVFYGCPLMMMMAIFDGQRSVVLLHGCTFLPREWALIRAIGVQPHGEFELARCQGGPSNGTLAHSENKCI